VLTDNENRYIEIIEFICSYNQISKEQLITLLKYRDNKYLLFLIFKKYRCTDKNVILKILNLKSKQSINLNFKKAEERFFINKEFREKYFTIEEKISTII